MLKSVSLSEYVRHRNGVALGAPNSLRNMLHRSLGARSFAAFWQYWNPIWGYYLAKFIYSPLRKVLPAAVALVATFVLSGALHDLAASLVMRTTVFVCTPWFLLLGIGVVIGRSLEMDLSRYAGVVRAAANILYLAGALVLSLVTISSLGDG